MSYILGIVGSEGRKFTAETEAKARRAIRGAIKSLKATAVCSGECPLGGIDIWAKEEAISLLGEDGYIGCPPKHNRWAPHGFQERNIKIAETSHVTICLTLRSKDQFPANYDGMLFDHCYHCGVSTHVKSGGCWTTKYSRSIGKPGYTLVIE